MPPELGPILTIDIWQSPPSQEDGRIALRNGGTWIEKTQEFIPPADEPADIQHCIGKVEAGDPHRTCCCATEQRCRVAVRHATRRMYAAGLDPREVYLRLQAASGWDGVEEGEKEQGKPFPFGYPGGLADGLDMVE